MQAESRSDFICQCDGRNCTAKVSLSESASCEVMRLGRAIVDGCKTKRPHDDQLIDTRPGYSIYRKVASTRKLAGQKARAK